MPTVSAGSTGTDTQVGPFNSVLITNNHNDTGRWWFTPVDSGQGANPFMSGTGPMGGVGDHIGPAAGSFVVGPFGVPGTISVQCETGSIFFQAAEARIGRISAAGITTTSASTLNGGSLTFTPANVNATISPSGTGTVTINPAGGGNMDNVVIGQSTRRVVAATTYYVSRNDLSGTPGNVTTTASRARVAIAAGQSSVTVTNTQVTADGSVFATIAQATADATLTHITRTVCAAGSFTVYGNAAATANTVIDTWFVLN